MLYNVLKHLENKLVYIITNVTSFKLLIEALTKSPFLDRVSSAALPIGSATLSSMHLNLTIWSGTQSSL